MAALDPADQVRIDDLITAHTATVAAQNALILEWGTGLDASAATVDVLVLTDAVSTFSNNLVATGGLDSTIIGGTAPAVGNFTGLNVSSASIMGRDVTLNDGSAFCQIIMTQSGVTRHVIVDSGGGHRLERYNGAGAFVANALINDADGVNTQIADKAGVGASFQNSNANPQGIEIYYSAVAPLGTANWFLRCLDNSNYRFTVDGDGSCLNRLGTYGMLSDEKAKQDIITAKSQRADIKAIHGIAVNYRLKEEVSAMGESATTLLGYVAQDMEGICPSLVGTTVDMEHILLREATGNEEAVYEDRPTGETTKFIKTSVLGIKTTIALGEHLWEYDADKAVFEARLAALESAQ